MISVAVMALDLGDDILMARATCRCGQPLEMPPDGSEHVVCPRCEARVRIIRKRREPEPAGGDGFLRFSCPCGRRLKVSAIDRPSHGKCPDCDRVVPVPINASAASSTLSESPTEELSATEMATLDVWSKSHARKGSRPMSTAEMPLNSPAHRGEAGLRVCPKCGKPIHLGADACRACGISVPKR